MFATVTKILFQGRRAVGVQYERDGLVYKVYANKEVIMAAGAINTPQLLMLSGIGPALTLKRFRIQQVAALERVGQGLQDHPSLSMNFTANATFPADSDVSIENFLKWQLTGQLFGSPLACGIGPFRTHLSKSDDDVQVARKTLRHETLDK